VLDLQLIIQELLRMEEHLAVVVVVVVDQQGVYR